MTIAGPDLGRSRSPDGGRGPRRFVGRERELAELRDALQDAATGRGRLFAVTGEPGIGKTRLVDELVDEARTAGHATIWGRCWEGGGAPAYWVWVQVLRACLADGTRAGTDDRAADGATDLAQLVPELATRLGTAVGAGPDDDVERGRFRIFDAITRLLRRTAEARPLVLVLEDVHAADRSSLALLEFFAHALRDARILAVITYREGDARRHPDVADRLESIARNARHLSLRGLAQPAVAELVAAGYGTAPAAGLVDSVFRATNGNPFFVDELVRLMVAEGRSDGAFAVPHGVRAAIRRRLAPLSAECRATLAMASVLGREFAFGELMNAVEQPVDELLQRLGEARDAGLVVEVDDGVARWAFAHTLVRETLYDDLPPAVRVRRHRQIAEALEVLYRADPQPHLTTLAHHFCGAAPGGDVGKAVEYSTLAARRATAIHAWEEAAAHYRRALSAAELGEPDDARQGELLLALGEAEECGNAFARAKVTFERAAAIARVLGRPEMLARAALGIGGQWARKLTSAVMDRSESDLLQEALVALGGQNPALRVRLLGRLALRLRFSADPARVEMLSQESIAVARANGDPHELGWALAFRHGVLLGPDGLEERREIAHQMLALAERLGDRDLVLRAHALRVFDLGDAGQMTLLEDQIERYAHLAAALTDPFDEWMSTMCRAMMALLRGRLDAAERLAHDAVVVANRAPGQQSADHNAGMCYAAHMVLIGRERDDIESKERLLTTLADRYPGVATLRAFRALLRLDLGWRDEARREFEAMAAKDFTDIPRDSLWLATVCLLTELAAGLEDARRAAMLYALLVPYAGRNVMMASPACFGSASRYLGILAHVQGMADAAERHFVAARAENERLGAPAIVAWTLHDHAVAAAARGAAAVAATMRAEAAAVAARRGMTRLARLLGPRAEASGAAVPRLGVVASSEAVLRREGEHWTVAFEGRVSHVKHAKGLSYLAALLAAPGREIPALDLVASTGDAGVFAAPAELPAPSARRADEEPGEDSRPSYRRRLDEVRAELEQAGAGHDLGRVTVLRAEEAALVAELSRSAGLVGQGRRAGSARERARLNATRAIRVALVRITAMNAALGDHLTRTVTTGSTCRYAPDPRVRIVWRL